MCIRDSPTALDMSDMDFSKDFSPEEMAALSSIAGQMGAGKVVAMQKLAGQMSAVQGAGFDAKGMMGALDNNGIGIGTAMKGLATSGMVDMQAVMGTEGFDMGSFDPAGFASMNVAEMGMDPAMMAGALGALPVGAATAALETLAQNPDAMGKMGPSMTGAIAATMAGKGMGGDMMKSMEASIGINGMSGMAEGMKGIEGMQEIGKAMADMGMENMAKSLSTAFANPEVGIAGAMLVTQDGLFTPGSYRPMRYTFLIWVMVIVGGSGNNFGAVLGGFAVWFLWIEAAPLALFLINFFTSGLAETNAFKVHLINSIPYFRFLMM